MEDKKELAVVKQDLQNELDSIVLDIIKEKNPEELKDLTNLFNMNQAKKSIERANKYSKLLDNVVDKMSERIEKRADQFTNEDLLDYLNAIQKALEKNEMTDISNEMAPIIQYQQNNQVNINVDSGLNRESREKVMDAIKAIMEKANNGE